MKLEEKVVYQYSLVKEEGDNLINEIGDLLNKLTEVANTLDDCDTKYLINFHGECYDMKHLDSLIDRLQEFYFFLEDKDIQGKYLIVTNKD